MAWKIIQLETECKIFVFLCAEITSPFLSAFLRKNKTTNKKPRLFCGIGNNMCGVLWEKSHHLDRNHIHAVTEMAQVGRDHWRWSSLTPCSSRVTRPHHSGLWLSMCVCKRPCYFSSENRHLCPQHPNKCWFSFVLLPAVESYSTCSPSWAAVLGARTLFCVSAAPGTNGKENKLCSSISPWKTKKEGGKKAKVTRSIGVNSSAILQVSCHSELEPRPAFLSF